LSQICSHQYCELEVYRNEEECIFHCDKNENNGWVDNEKWDGNKVNEFWKQLNQIVIIADSKNHSIYDILTIWNDNINERVPSIKNCIIPPLKNISNLSYDIPHYYFNNCIFLDNFKIESFDAVDIKNAFSFSQCIFHGKFEIKLIFGTFHKPIELRGNKHQGNIEFYGDFRQKIEINNLQTPDNNVKIDIKFTPELVIFTSAYKALQISNLDRSNVENINFWHTKIDQLVINNSYNYDNITKINALRIQEAIIENIFVKQLELKNLSLHKIDFIENSKVLFERIDTNVLKLKKISQDAKYIQFHHIRVMDEFICDRIEFKNTYFNDFDIENAKKSISKTSFIDAYLNSIEWGKVLDINAKRDIFRQLKYVNDKQGNHIDANNFYVMEMKEYEKNLDKKPWFSNWWQEKFVFLMGKKISNFGQSWFLPFLWLIICNLGFYIYLNISKAGYSIEQISFSIIILIVLWIIGVFIYTHRKEFGSTKKRNYYILQHLAIIIALALIINHYEFGKVGDIAKFMSLKLPDDKDSYIHIWLLNKAVSGFIFYHFIVALRRQTKR